MAQYTMIFTYNNGVTEIFTKKFKTYMDAMFFKSSYFANHAYIVHAEMRMSH